MGRYGGYRHLAGIVTFAKDHVWPPLSRRSGDDAVISDGVYHPIALLVNSIVDGSGPLIKANFQRRHDVTRSGVA